MTIQEQNNIVLCDNGWHQVKVPLPFSLKWVNSYLIPEQDGYTIIDPGLRTDEAIQMWEMTLQELSLQWSDITRIILTHQHPDHYGLAGYIQEISQAPVLMSKASHAYARRMWGGDNSYTEQLRSLNAEHGMPSELIEAIEENLTSFVAMVSPQPEVTYIEAGSQIQIGGLEWLLIDAPGHAYGQLCFYEQSRGWMLCGDQVLPHITPNVSIIPGESDDPLEDFLQSLEKLKGFDVTLAFPGHRDPFTNFAGRISELQQHHVRRLDRMCDLLSKEPLTAFGMCEALFGARIGGNAHNLRFAMAETLAHLVHLERRNRITSVKTDGVYCYSVQSL